MTLRRLPGRRRGFLFGESLWAANDHILAVKSSRFRETYRRYYFRDIHAIVVTHCPRYPFSTHAAALGIVLLVGLLIPNMFWPILLLLTIAVSVWLYVSVKQSCLCRIYTAVSCEKLPSLYRTWTARQFLAQVEPLILTAQADLPQPASIADGETPGGQTRSEISLSPLEPAVARSEPRPRLTPVSLLLLGSMITAVVYAGFDLSWPEPRFVWLAYVILTVQAASAVLAIVEHYRGRLAAGVQRVAIVLLVLMGGSLYIQTVVSSFERIGQGVTSPALEVSRPGLLVRQISMACEVVLTLVCVGVMSLPPGHSGRRELKEVAGEEKTADR